MSASPRSPGFFTVLILLLMSLSRVMRAEEAAWPTDMIVASFDDKTFVLLAMPERGAIYCHALTAGDTKPITLSEFEELYRSPAYSRPSALAFRKGKLLFVDRQTDSLVELDPATREARVLVSAPQIRDPVSLAVSDTGVIAIGEDGPDRVTLFSPGSALRTLGVEIDEPDRLSFIGSDLLVLDRHHGTVAFVRGDTRREEHSEPTTKSLATIRRMIPRIDDLVYFRGIFYAVDGKRVLSLVSDSDTNLPAILTNAGAGVEPLRIAAEQGSLLILGREAVLQISRPTAVSINFELPTDKSVVEIDAVQYEALTALYAYLDAHGLLPVREVEAQHQYSSLSEFLRDQDVLIRRPEAARLPAASPDADSRLGRVLCRLNEIPCEPGPAVGSILRQSVTIGQKVRLPGVTLEKSLTTSKVSLGQKTVQDHLRERVLPEQAAAIGTDDLFRMNKRFLQTWEAVAARENFLALEQPGGSLEPGTIVKLDQGRLVILGSLGGCGAELGEARREEVLGHPLAPISAVGDILPRVRSAAQGAAPTLAGENEISFDGLLDESIDAAALTHAAEALRQSGNCSGVLQDADVFVVVAARKALGARYNILGRGGSPRILSEDEIRRWSLLGHPDPDRQWSLIVDEPVYVQARLAKLDGGEISPSEAVGPELGRAEEILATQPGAALYLPATKWRLATFVVAADLLGSTSEIQALDLVPGVDVLSLEHVVAAAQGETVSVAATQDDLMRAAIHQNRMELLEQIDYITPPPGLSGLIIGLGENKKSVHCGHPDFVTGNGSLWQEEKGEIDLEPMPCPEGAAGIGSPPLKEFLRDLDHGDHVAGLIAGRGSLAPGLASGTGLFLIDTSSPAGLDKSIENAIKRGVNIFSFSFELENDPALDKLKKTMREKWPSVLFIAAAGNDGEDLAGLNGRPPVSWVDDIENIIGVGASDWNHNLLGTWTPDPLKPQITEKGSNYGKKYVQLLAPGLKIYSTASENRYAVATGSSQAVPQVTAAVASLQAQSLQYLDPSIIKARLIYAADWFSPNFDDKVWGGSLNFRRAVWRPDLNLLTEKSDTSAVRWLSFAGSSSVRVEEGEVDDPRGDPVDRPAAIPFKNILRIQWMGAEQRWRVIYLEGISTVRKMRILKGALLSGSIPCGQLRRWDSAAEGFAPENLCNGDLDVTDIFNYVARLPDKRIRF